MGTTTYEEILEEKGVLFWKTVGVSMRPLICEGRDFIVIRKPQRPYQKYDVVLFRRPGVVGRGAYVLHRILKVNKDGTYWIVGDNCCSGEIVKEENIIGILASMVRKGKNASLDSLGYKLYVHLWCDFYPIRFLILRCKGYPRRILSKFYHMIKGK